MASTVEGAVTPAAASALPAADPSLPPAPHDPSQPLQVWPALLPAEDHRPAIYPFGRWPLPAAGVLLASALSWASVTMSPLQPGHVLIMPRSNIARVRDLPPDQLCDLGLMAQHIARVFEEKLGTPATLMGQTQRRKLNHPLKSSHPDVSSIQDGAAAGQTVACVHIHLIPRSVGDAVSKMGKPPSAAASAAATVAVTASAGEAAAAAPASANATVLDPPVTRKVTTRAEQAVEARGYAEWLRAAGVPAFIVSSGVRIHDCAIAPVTQSSPAAAQT